MTFSSVPDQAETAPDRPARVLVVEDEVLIRILVSESLRDAGFEVIEAFNGDEAMDILRATPAVDLVLSDVRMPGAVDGLELLRRVRARLPALPVILTSGHLDPGVAMVEGATHFLAKPYLIDRIVSLITMELESLK